MRFHYLTKDKKCNTFKPMLLLAEMQKQLGLYIDDVCLFVCELLNIYSIYSQTDCEIQT